MLLLHASPESVCYNLLFLSLSQANKRNQFVNRRRKIVEKKKIEERDLTGYPLFTRPGEEKSKAKVVRREMDEGRSSFVES